MALLVINDHQDGQERLLQRASLVLHTMGRQPDVLHTNGKLEPFSTAGTAAIVLGDSLSLMHDLDHSRVTKPKAPGSAHRREYERRVNRVIDYVEAHIGDELTLEKLAAVAAFSPFHFHRVFLGITGETLSDFIRRIRLERAASSLGMLRETSVLEIALLCGFSSAATFARAFKSHFGMSASEWRDGGALKWSEALRSKSKQGKALRKQSQKQRKPRKAIAGPKRHRPGSKSQGLLMPIEIRELPPYRVAYVRHVGPYGEGGRIGALWMNFERWIRAHGLRRDGTLTIGIGHDAPTIAAPETLRYDACLVVDDDFKPDRSVNMAELPGGRYAVAQFEGTATQLSEAWHLLWSTWLPGSGYQPEDRPCGGRKRCISQVPAQHSASTSCCRSRSPS
jgi:AraC family transcriptional regulator